MSASASEARIAGSDTREAVGTSTVRAAALGAALIAAVAWAAGLGMPAAFQDRAVPGPWLAAATLAGAAAAAVVAWRLDRRAAGSKDEGDLFALPPGAGAAVLVAFAAVMVAGAGSEDLAALALPVVAVLGGWTVGRAARTAATACVPDVVPAAGGTVVAGALCGLIPAGHLGLVASSSGVFRAAGWTAVYAVGSAIWLFAAERRLAPDLRRVTVRARPRTAETATTCMLGLEGISVSFGSNVVLRGVTVRAAAGEVLALVGGNGAGKSTLLHVAAGLLVPESGRVDLAGEDVSTLRPEERAAAGLAFVSGARPVFPDMTVAENLRVAAFRTHLTARSFGSATDQILQLVPALADRLDAKAGVLSGGQQRLLAVAQTLYRRPKVLLADELTLGLDAQARVAVLDLLRLLANEGVAVVAVDHDLPALLPRSDQAALLADARVKRYRKPERLLAEHTELLPATFLAGAGR